VAALAVGLLAGVLLLRARNEPAPTPVGQRAGPDRVNPAPLDRQLPTPAELGPDWVNDPQSAALDVVDGPGLLHPCGVQHRTDAQRGEVARLTARQHIPVGAHLVVELARYAGSAQPAADEAGAAVAGCRRYDIEYNGQPAVPVAVEPLASPAPGGAGAYLEVTEDEEPAQYVYLVARQGDMLVSAVVYGEADRADLVAFARQQFSVALRKAAGEQVPISTERPLIPRG
jgi:hypothetical protein